MTKPDRRRLLLVGAGRMGERHAAKLAARADVEIRAVVDLELSRAAAVADPFGAVVASDHRPFMREADAAIVAVPTRAHFAVVRDLIRAGLDVLVEKPVTAGVEEAELLSVLVQAHERVVQVGHSEWFHPAWSAARGTLVAPQHLSVVRMGGLRPSTTDVDVVWDLMIHDLQMVVEVMGEEPAAVEAVGQAIVSDSADAAWARLTYGDRRVDLLASRVSSCPRRQWTIRQANETVVVDLLESTVLRIPDTPAVPEPVAVLAGDSLDAEHAHFFAALESRFAGAVGLPRILPTVRLADRISRQVASRMRGDFPLPLGEDLASAMSSHESHAGSPPGRARRPHASRTLR